MDRGTAISRLKALLRKDVGYLCRRSDLQWSAAIVRTVRDIREADARAVFFGGTLRSLLLSRLQQERLGRPRDLDIVIEGVSLEALREKFFSIIKRETRFGGFQLERMSWHFDVWPLHRTWAFLQDGMQAPRFSALPSTTFLNLEAIAIDVWPPSGRPRTIYSGNDQFFKGIISRTLEINREDNPFPSLCVVRALVMAASTRFAIGPRLARYLALNGPTVSDAQLEEIQLKHYGRMRYDTSTMRTWLEHIGLCYARNSQSSVTIPTRRQLTLWPETEQKWPSVNVHILAEGGDVRV